MVFKKLTHIPLGCVVSSNYTPLFNKVCSALYLNAENDQSGINLNPQKVFKKVLDIYLNKDENLALGLTSFGVRK